VVIQVWVSQFFYSCSYHLEFPSLGYSKQFYHILFSSPTQNLLQSSFSASLVPHATPSPAPQIRPVNRRHCALYTFIYLLTYLLIVENEHKSGDKQAFGFLDVYCSLEMTGNGYCSLIMATLHGALCDILYKRLRNTLTYLLTYLLFTNCHSVLFRRV